MTRGGVAVIMLASCLFVVCSARPVENQQLDNTVGKGSSQGHGTMAGILLVVVGIVCVLLCAGGEKEESATTKQMRSIDNTAMSRRTTMDSNVNELHAAKYAFINEEVNPLRQQIIKEHRQAQDDDEGKHDTRRRHMTLSSDPRWIHATINKREAKELLLANATKPGLFLVRPKKPEEGIYALDMVVAGEGGLEVEQHVISRAGTGEFVFDGKQVGRLMSLEALVEFLCKPNNKALRRNALTEPLLTGTVTKKAPKKKQSMA